MDGTATVPHPLSGAQEAGLGAAGDLYGQVFNSATPDAQNTNWDFGNNGGGFTLPVPEPECSRVMAGTNRLLKMARACGVAVVHASTVWEAPLLATHPFERAMLELKESFTPGNKSDFARHKSPGSIEGQLMPNLDVQPSDLLVDSKRTFDSFLNTPLEMLLRAMKRNTVLVAGCNTNTCVLSTTYGGYNRGFRMVIVEEPSRGLALGFLTKEFTVDRGHGPEPLMAVYVPTNHLYLGDIVLCPRAQAFFPDVTVEEGIRIFLTGGMSLPGTVSRHVETPGHGGHS